MRFAVARREGLTESIVDLIDDGFETSTLSERHKAILRYTDAFLDDPSALSDDAREKLSEHLSPAEIVELTAGIALFMGFSKIAIALGEAPESMPTTVVPTPG